MQPSAQAVPAAWEARPGSFPLTSGPGKTILHQQRPFHMLRRVHIPVISLLVGAYLSTWSAALLQTIVFPAIGSGPAKISASRGPSAEKPQISFSQRRHTPLVKTLSLVAPPADDTWYPAKVTWVQRFQVQDHTVLPSTPEYSHYIGRAPPSC
jgi:hypothetical protein